MKRFTTDNSAAASTGLTDNTSPIRCGGRIAALIMLLFGACSSAQSTPPASLPALSPLIQPDGQAVAPVRQIAAAQDGLYLVDETGKLLHAGADGKTVRLAEAFSPHSLLTARDGAVSGVYRGGLGELKLGTWLKDTYPAYGSFPAAPQGSSVWHSGCLIAVAEADTAAYPVRTCPEKETLNISAERRDIKLLSDSRPVLWQNQVLLLGGPDAQTYRHGVLGDAVEARTLYLLDAQTLRDTAAPYTLPYGLVFENNTLTVYHDKVIAIISGGGSGARLAVMSPQNGRWRIEAQSEPLPHHRWQSPFIFDDKLYAVQMPHLKGALVRYDEKDGLLTAQELGSGLSNHAIGSRDINIGAVLPDYALIPQAGYRRIYALDKAGGLHRLEPELPAFVIRSAAYGNASYWLLNDGSVWIWRQPEAEKAKE